MQWIRALVGRTPHAPAGLPVGAFALAFAGSFLYFSLVDDDGRGDVLAPASGSDGRVDAPTRADQNDARRGRSAAGSLVVTFSVAADEPGNGYLARVALDGSVAHVLLEPPHDGGQASNASPAVSPDGTTVAFQLANADGTGERLLLGDQHDYSSPAWSPDGRRLALVRDGQLAVMGVDAATPRPLIGATGAMKVRPSWSPDGTRIAFIREPGSIVIVAADGSHAVRVPLDKPATAAVWEPT